MMAPDRVRAIERLASQIDPAMLTAPHTAGDPHQADNWPDVAPLVVNYLARNVVGSPWGNYLTLATLVLSARHLDVARVLSAAKILHGRFSALFAACAIPSIADWSLEAHLYPYLHGELLPEDSANKRANFWKAYRSTTGHVHQWLTGLSQAEQHRFAAYTLPIVEHHQVRQFVRSIANQQAQDQRKRETDAVLPHLAALRAEGHVRYNRLVRLRRAFHEATAYLEQCPELLPLAFSSERVNRHETVSRGILGASSESATAPNVGPRVEPALAPCQAAAALSPRLTWDCLLAGLGLSVPLPLPASMKQVWRRLLAD